MSSLTSAGPSRADLPVRLEAVAELVRIGRDRDGFDAELLAESDAVLRRAAERLRLSAGHTVVAIAGGTGSGKSMLFNALAGVTFSPTGVTRPTTRNVHACVWGMEGAAPLLDWLGVERRYRYARASALDEGESALQGLILLDLPDHDSVVVSSSAAVERISKLADMLIWVLDPQKYADAAVHNRYLVPLAGHAEVLTVVLNQTDLLTKEEADDCGEDLRRLLDSEGLEAARLYAVSARTGAGLDEVRGLLAEAVLASQAAAERISADIDSLLGRYAAYAAGPAAPDSHPGPEPGPEPGLAAADGDDAHPPRSPGRDRPPWEDAVPDEEKRREPDPAELVRNVPEGPATALTDAFADTSGLSAVADGQASVREARAERLTSWPVTRVLRRRTGPVRSVRGAADGAAPAGGTAADGEGTGGTAGLAPQSEVDNAITAFADAVGGRLPEPWPASVVRAARSRADEVPPALAEAVRLPGHGEPVPLWCRLVAVGQWLLLAIAAAALIWAAVIGAARRPGQPALLGDVSLIPWLVVLAAVMLLLGWLASVGSRNMAAAAADRERDRAARAMRERVEAVARDLVLAPAGREIAAYERFRRELAVASGDPGRVYRTAPAQ